MEKNPACPRCGCLNPILVLFRDTTACANCLGELTDNLLNDVQEFKTIISKSQELHPVEKLVHLCTTILDLEKLFDSFLSASCLECLDKFKNNGLLKRFEDIKSRDL